MTQLGPVVIGAGVVGCLAARELAARDPAATLTVLDRDAAGAGASRRSAGLHLPRGATPRTRRMSADSHAFYAALGREGPGAAIRPVGATVLSRRPLAGEYLATAAPAAAGPGAWRIAGCHYADVYQLTQALAAELRPRARFLEGTAVTGLAAGPDTVTVTTGTGERIMASAVVVAPGPWLAEEAWRDLVAPLGLRVKKIVALHIGQAPGPADEAVIFADDDAFLLPLADRGHWLFSFTSQEWDVEPDARPAGLSAADLSAARAVLCRHAPGLARAISGGRVFCDAYSPAREPVVRALDPAGRIVFAGAAGGSGYRLGPAIAAEAAGLVLAAPALPPPGSPPPGALPPGSSPPLPPPGALPPGPARTDCPPRSEGVTGDPQYV